MDANIRKPNTNVVATPHARTRRRPMKPLPHCFIIKLQTDAAMSPRKARPATQKSILDTKASDYHPGIAEIAKLARRKM